MVISSGILLPEILLPEIVLAEIVIAEILIAETVLGDSSKRFVSSMIAETMAKTPPESKRDGMRRL